MCSRVNRKCKNNSQLHICIYVHVLNVPFIKENSIFYILDHPMEKLPQNVTIDNFDVEVNITMNVVFPIPECNATDGVSKINTISSMKL